MGEDFIFAWEEIVKSFSRLKSLLKFHLPQQILRRFLKADEDNQIWGLISDWWSHNVTFYLGGIAWNNLKNMSLIKFDVTTFEEDYPMRDPTETNIEFHMLC